MKNIYEQQVNKAVFQYILEHAGDFELGGIYSENGHVTDPSGVLTYYNKFLNSLDEGGRVSVEYKKKGLSERLWGTSCGITNISRRLRHTIAGEFNIDIDIKNCHPTFLQKYCQDNNIECPQLDFYILNRDALKESDPSIKDSVLVLINGGNLRAEPSEFLVSFNDEVKLIHSRVLEIEKATCKKLATEKTWNVAGRALNLCLTKIESKALEVMVKYFKARKVKITSLAFDGLTIERNSKNIANIDNYLRGCEDAINFSLGIGVVVVEKEMNEGFELPAQITRPKKAKSPTHLLSFPERKEHCKCEADHSKMFEVLNGLTRQGTLVVYDEYFKEITLFIAGVCSAPCLSMFIHHVARLYEDYEQSNIDDYCLEIVSHEGLGWDWATRNIPSKKREYAGVRKFLREQVKKNVKGKSTAQIVDAPFLPEDDIYDFVEEYRVKIFDDEDTMVDDFVSKIQKYAKYIMFPECYVVNKGDGEITIENGIIGNTRFQRVSEEGIVSIITINLFNASGCLRKRMDVQSRLPQYKNLTFYPFVVGEVPVIKKGELNMYQGFQAKKVDEVDEKLIEPILTHIRSCWANDDLDVNDYILQWFRHLFTRPAEKSGTVLILYGQQGSGKGILIDNFIIPFIYGDKVSCSTQGLTPIVQRFNSICMNKCFVCCNEVSSGENSFHDSFERLKSLITDPTMSIEKKGIDMFNDYPNFMNFIFTTNNYNSVKLGRGDRRYVCLETSGRFCKKYEYFERLLASCNQETADHFYTYICGLAKTRNIKNIPTTSLKEDMMIHTISGAERFANEVLNLAPFENSKIKFDENIWENVLANNCENNTILAKHLYKAYQIYCKDNGDKTISSALFGREIKQFIQSKRAKSGIEYTLHRPNTT